MQQELDGQKHMQLLRTVLIDVRSYQIVKYSTTMVTRMRLTVMIAIYIKEEICLLTRMMEKTDMLVLALVHE